jgi:Mrp family chromosome partitioning ATPase
VLINEVNRLKAEAARVGDAEVELRALEREANAQRELLESYLTQYREAASRQNRDYLPVDARIISRAVMPSESFFPKIVPFTLAGAAAALVLAIVGILAVALLSGKAFRESDRTAQAVPERIELEMPQSGIAKPTPRKVAAQVNKSTRARNLPAVNAPALAPETAFDGMAYLDGSEFEDAAMAPSAANDPEIFVDREAAAAISALGRGVIAVVSPGGDAGSRLTVDLVRAVAGSDRSLVVIDITGSGQPSQLMLGDVNLEGLRDFLAGSVSLADTIYQDTGSSAHVIGVGMGREPGNGAMARLKSAIGILSQSYDFVVLDCGYVAASALEGIVGPQTIIVIATPGASNAELVETEQELRMTGFDEIVCVKPGAKAGGALRVA